MPLIEYSADICASRIALKAIGADSRDCPKHCRRFASPRDLHNFLGARGFREVSGGWSNEN
jgi:hypothetical protein